jgi:hypothetical protein
MLLIAAEIFQYRGKEMKINISLNPVILSKKRVLVGFTG